MGRPSMSPEVIRTNKVNIISAARKMIRSDGIQSVSARSLGSSVGMNSALIYRYFEDIDDVILFACMHALREYADEMSKAAEPDTLSEVDLYLLTWDIFSKHAFNNPDEFNTLFFSRHSAQLPAKIKAYIELFPEEVANKNNLIVQAMLSSSSLRERNLIVLIPVLEQKVPDDKIILINDMTVSYFYALLTQLLGHDQGVTAEYQTQRMLTAVRFIIGL